MGERVEKSGGRLLSLDMMRGSIMVLLMLEGSFLYEHLHETNPSGFFDTLLLQFFHHPWNGLRFWDLIQPGFMFIAGVSLAYSYTRQQEKGVPWATSLTKMLKRSWWLLFWGVVDFAVESDGIYFTLWNVLVQLSFTLLVSFLIFNWSYRNQILFSLGLLILTELLYRYTGIPGFDQPFVDQKNFGNFMDLVLMGQVNSDGWVAINCLPTAAHTIWGVLAGKWLMSSHTSDYKIKGLVISGLATLIVGYAMDFLSITPIIKKIATSSFTLASGGWCLLYLALLYWWIDVKSHKRYLLFFTIVGMNSLFIYLFFEIAGRHWFNGYIHFFADGLLGPLHISSHAIAIFSSIVVFILEWFLCRFLYLNKIVVKV